jgi:Family of unknown function (DUF5999)
MVVDDPQTGPDQVSVTIPDGNLPAGGTTMCNHSPGCPEIEAADRCSAHVVSDHLHDQGWCRLCNGLILFDDGHYLTPDGHDHVLTLSA